MKKKSVIISSCMSMAMALMLIGQTVPMSATEIGEEVTTEVATTEEEGKLQPASEEIEELEQASVMINGGTFPDSYFRSYVKDYFDLNGNGYLSEQEINAVSYIDVSECEVNSLQGIEYFVNLTELICRGNNLSSLDVSKNTNLQELWCDDNNLSSLDVSNNVYLTELYCGRNNLSSLDVSNNPKLVFLECYYNNLSSLDVSKNTNLQELWCNDNNLSSLDVSNNPKLVFLECYYNNLSSLDVSNNPNLAWLSCYGNNISSLDVSKNAALNSLACSYNYMRTLSLPNQKLNYLNIQENFFTPEQVNGFATKASGEFIGDPQIDKNTGPWAYVSHLYSACLGRSASDNEIIYWDKYLRRVVWDGNSVYTLKTGIQVASNFVFSPECSKRCVSDDQYITMLYQSLMGRTPAASEVNYWKGILSSGMSRQYVFKCFAESPEFTKICQSYNVTRGSYALTQARDKNPNLTKYVNRIYVNALGRNGDADGLNYWCNAILAKKSTPVTAAEYFILSQEFTNKQLNHTEYVKVLYRTFMGREADQGGLSYWVGQLNKGESRRNVLRSFAGCPEFKKIIASFGL